MTAALVAVLLTAACSSDSDESVAAASATDLYWFVIGRADGDAQRRIYDGWLARQEGFKKDCMGAAGFDYDVRSARSQYALALEHSLDPDEFAAQYALGVSAMIGVGPPPMDSVADPNEARLERMSDAERDAWFTQEDRCIAEAEIETPMVADWELVGTLVDDLHARVRADKRMVDAEATWSACMAEQGFTYPSRPAMIDEFKSEADRLVAAGAVPETADNHHELHELQDLEFEVSKADTVCDSERSDVERAVYDEARSSFIGQYEAALVPALGS